MTTAHRHKIPLQDIPVTQLKGVGSKIAEKLEQLEINSVQDLLFHLPLRYQDRTRITPVGALQPGHHRLIQGTVKGADVVFGKRRSLLCRLQDNTGTVTLRFFHFSAAQKNALQPGVELSCFGECRRGPSGLEMIHPEYKQISQASPALADTLTPIYPTTEGLQQPRWRALMTQALALMQPGNLQELLPEQITAPLQLPALEAALRYLHAPPQEANTDQLLDGSHPCQQRLAFEELIAHHLSMLELRHSQRSGTARAMPQETGQESLQQRFLERLPFSPTGAQIRVGEEIACDLAQPTPMMRLVQGDVGSGKTLVAARAALQAIAAGHQVALMAPTEILAEQHLHNFTQWFQPLGIQVGWLSGKQKAAERREQLEQVATGQAKMVVGTHALFQEQVAFDSLALSIIDEQHRFGVHQRLSLREKGYSNGECYPHQLIMTATPIPRTLAMSAYADLDCSVIDELPAGRIPVNTVLINEQRRQQVIERIRLACSEGKQAYWVCTLIEESEALQCQAAEVLAEELQGILPQTRIGLVHGRLKPDAKAATMQAFKDGELDLLVATTVIEVGVDVPNASLMIIENPERLGLAQLHQLRGRVGRGSDASHCVLMYKTPLSKTGRARLETMRATTDGFVIAEKDLELRGPGEVLGTRQTGLIQFRMADIQRDASMLPQVKQAAQCLFEQHPHRINPLTERWIHHAARYANA